MADLRRRISSLHRKLTAGLDGAARARYLLRRIEANGGLTEADVDELAAKMPLAERERADYLREVRRWCERRGIATDITEEDELSEVQIDLYVRLHICLRSLAWERGESTHPRVPWDLDEAFADYEIWRREQVAQGMHIPVLRLQTYKRLCEQTRHLQGWMFQKPPT